MNEPSKDNVLNWRPGPSPHVISGLLISFLSPQPLPPHWMQRQGISLPGAVQVLACHLGVWSSANSSSLPSASPHHATKLPSLPIPTLPSANSLLSQG